MRSIVKLITFIAFALIILGGAALDGENIIIPVLMILPALAWLSLIIWVNREVD